eukprot:jgi/Chrzof1/10451/UNPLg00378.t1
MTSVMPTQLSSRSFRCWDTATVTVTATGVIFQSAITNSSEYLGFNPHIHQPNSCSSHMTWLYASCTPG